MSVWLGRAPEVRVEATMLYWFRKCVTCDGAPMRNTTTRSSGAHERGGDRGATTEQSDGFLGDKHN